MRKIRNIFKKKFRKVDEKLKIQYINDNAIGKRYEIQAKFQDFRKSFVFSHQNNKSNYENVILGSNNDVNNKQYSHEKISEYKNIVLHDYSRIFLRGKAEVDPKTIREFMISPFILSTLDNHDNLTISVELGVATFEDSKRNACHTGWYHISEENGNVSLLGMLFFKLNTFGDLLKYFQNPLEISLSLTKIDKKNLAIENYPWNRCAKTFFENKYIFFIK